MRVRESCFDILRGVVDGKTVLDLFAGSGALGIEALSQGAQEAVFVDAEKSCVMAVKKNLSRLGFPGLRAYLKDAFEAVKDFSVYREKFEIIFLDPPYHNNMITKALQALAEYDILSPSGYIVVFCYRTDDFSWPDEGFSLALRRRYGQTLLSIIQKA